VWLNLSFNDDKSPEVVGFEGFLEESQGFYALSFLAQVRMMMILSHHSQAGF
jgi:hypothetical protein